MSGAFADDMISLSSTIVSGAIFFVVSSLIAAVVFLFRQYAKGRDDHEAELKERIASFQKAAERTTTVLEMVATKKAVDAGLVPVPKILPALPEHNSPTTDRQKFASDIEAIKAREVAAILLLEKAGVMPGSLPNTRPAAEPAPVTAAQRLPAEELPEGRIKVVVEADKVYTDEKTAKPKEGA